VAPKGFDRKMIRSSRDTLGRALRALQQKRPDLATKILNEVPLKDRQTEQYLFTSAIVFFTTREFFAAESTARSLTARFPANNYKILLADILVEQGRSDDAYAVYTQLPDSCLSSAAVRFKIGTCCLNIRRFAEAVEWLEVAVTGIEKPFRARAINNLGLAYRGIGQLPRALDCFIRSALLEPDYEGALINEIATLYDLRRISDAAHAVKKMLETKSTCAEALHYAGKILELQGRLPEALNAHLRAATHANHSAPILVGLSEAFIRAEQYERAIDLLGGVVGREHQQEMALGLYIHAKMKIADWSTYEVDRRELLARIARDEVCAAPFQLINLVDDLSVQRRLAEKFCNSRYVVASGQIDKLETAKARITIGYFSSDIYNHATICLAAEFLESHDKNRFKTILFNFSHKSHPDVRDRMARAFDEVLDVRMLSDVEIAALARHRGLDVAVDLKGHTLNSRTGIFARRTAPIQINFLGYPGTMGAPFIDYIVADETVIPPRFEGGYSEKVLRIPGCYQPNDRSRAVNYVGHKSDLGIASDSFVFCSFNSIYKITPEIFSAWMLIMSRASHSVLWLLTENESAKRNLRREAASRGIDSDRLIFARSMPSAEHLSRYRFVDLFLDTWPCGAHTTASDALRMECPIVTMTGESFASRVAASLLIDLRLEDLIVDNVSDYISLAVDLATCPDRLARVKSRVKEQVNGAAVFNGQQFARKFEAVVEEVVRVAAQQSRTCSNH
jgi:predicted O-linked N-acetylglucosamine transferase (SPINDLY family)